MGFGLGLMGWSFCLWPVGRVSLKNGSDWPNPSLSFFSVFFSSRLPLSFFWFLNLSRLSLTFLSLTWIGTRAGARAPLATHHCRSSSPPVVEDFGLARPSLDSLSLLFLFSLPLGFSLLFLSLTRLWMVSLGWWFFGWTRVGVVGFVWIVGLGVLCVVKTMEVSGLWIFVWVVGFVWTRVWIMGCRWRCSMNLYMCIVMNSCVSCD